MDNFILILAITALLATFKLPETMGWSPNDFYKYLNITTLLPTTTPSTTYQYFFEGIDWKDHPKHLQMVESDCNGRYVKCVRRTSILHKVCGYHYEYQYNEDYYSVCEIELENCIYRVNTNRGLYGRIHSDDMVYHVGEEYNCLKYTRRAKRVRDVHDMYSRDGRSRRFPEKMNLIQKFSEPNISFQKGPAIALSRQIIPPRQNYFRANNMQGQDNFAFPLMRQPYI